MILGQSFYWKIVQNSWTVSVTCDLVFNLCLSFLRQLKLLGGDIKIIQVQGVHHWLLFGHLQQCICLFLSLLLVLLNYSWDVQLGPADRLGLLHLHLELGAEHRGLAGFHIHHPLQLEVEGERVVVLSGENQVDVQSHWTQLNN